ncbi:hypothetical protein HYFRA_00004634 [Hymenoscyphus fraxineus]|uniref:AB hydrolase-1 domain-containing protein n=1 Tax=Hymenoscyphus fraxineus TaxID=746836 RepID=A0A9N9PPJ9_9HELO|nr:hypothetical protein HYFRA_00004634 [Hymenoscyphus fraxineus]
MKPFTMSQIPLDKLLLLALIHVPFTAANGAFTVYNYSQVSASCVNYTIPVYPTSTNIIFSNASKWTNNFGLAQFSADRTGQDPNQQPPVPFLTTSERSNVSYTIGATFCQPKFNGTQNSSTVILASHGLGFDRSYWNIPYQPEKYSFLDFVIGQGYSVLFYDRLGVGQSSKVSGYINQLSIQESILAQLAALVKSGAYTGTLGVPKSTVLIGHSFGSTITHAVAKSKPGAADAIILTGYSNNATLVKTPVLISAWQLKIANLFREAWSQLDTGYVTWVDLYSNVNTFFKAPGYTTDAAMFAEQHKQPFGITELLSGGSPGRTNYTGPVLVVAGSNDFIFCNGYCEGVLEPAAKLDFPSSSSLKTYVQPDTGHGMNFHTNATGFYKVVTDFLASNGL